MGRLMKKVMITGASGFLGYSIAKQASLNLEWDVYGVSSGRRKVILPEGVKQVTADLFEPQAVESLIASIEPDILVHLAWNLENRDFLNTLENIRCLEMSLHVLRTFAQHGGQRFIFSGSSAEYGYVQPVCRESDICCPSDLYGRCKLSFTETAQFFCQQNGIDYVTARYFSVYGVGENHLVHAIPLSIHTLMNGGKFTCKAPKNVWDYVYIDDVGKATFEIMRSNYIGIVNVGTGKATSMQEVFLTIAKELDAEHLLNFSDQVGYEKKSIASTEVLNNIIGYRCDTSLLQGIKRTVEWMRTKGV